MYNTLRAEVARKELSYKELAAAVGLKSSNLSQKINGFSDFSLKQAWKIKKALGVTMSIDDLFDLQEEVSK